MQDAHLAETEQTLIPISTASTTKSVIRRRRKLRLLCRSQDWMAVLQRVTWNPAGSVFIFNFVVAGFAMAFPGKNSRKSTGGVHRYSLFTSAERIARAWLKNCSVIFVRLKRICHPVRTCLTLCCSLTCRLRRAHHLVAGLPKTSPTAGSLPMNVLEDLNLTQLGPKQLTLPQRDTSCSNDKKIFDGTYEISQDASENCQKAGCQHALGNGHRLWLLNPDCASQTTQWHFMSKDQRDAILSVKESKDKISIAAEMPNMRDVSHYTWLGTLIDSPNRSYWVSLCWPLCFWCDRCQNVPQMRPVFNFGSNDSRRVLLTIVRISSEKAAFAWYGDEWARSLPANKFHNQLQFDH